MGDFAQFYQDGGFFMHIVTATAMGASFYAVKSGLLVRGSRSGEPQTRFDPTLRLASGLVWLALAVGLLGTMFGLIEVSGALNQAPEPVAFKYIARGMTISMYTLVFAVMVAIPLLFMVMMTRYRYQKKVLSAT